MVRYAPKPMRNAAIPALTRGWFSAPANSKLVDAARTRPPAVSAVIRMRASLAGGRAFFRGIRLGPSARPRILADAGVAGFSPRANPNGNSIAGADRTYAICFRSGLRDPGLDAIGPGIGAGSDPHMFAGTATGG